MVIEGLTKALARNLSMARIAVGASALLTTKLFARLFAGRGVAADPITRRRMFGVRDVALGLATIAALEQTSRSGSMVS